MTRWLAFVLVGASCVVIATTGASGAAQQLKVALVMDSQVSPHDFRAVTLRGFRRAVEEFRVQGRVVQLTPRASATATLTPLVRQKYDLVLVPQVRGLEDLNALAAVAHRFPATMFVMGDFPVDVLPGRPKNVQGSVWRVEQPSFLAGFLAGLMETRRPGKNVIGSVGGLPVPVGAFIAGYEAGARKADPRIKVLRGYAGSFFDDAKCEAVARRQIGEGAGAVFNVGGICGLGTIRAAKAEGVWAIGVDVDQAYLGRHVLTSVLKHWDVLAYATIEAFVRGKLRTGRNQVWSVRNGAVGLGKISPKVPRSFVRKVDRIRAQIIAGKIVVPARLP